MQKPEDVLAYRLRELPLPAPDPISVSRRALARAAAPDRAAGRRRVLAPALAVTAVVPLAWALLYFVPAAAVAVASAPGVGVASADVLREAGLGTGSSVTPQNTQARSSGYTVQLAGAYSDPLRTVVLLRFAPADAHAFDALTLRDQFGGSYELRSGYANTQTGEEALVFAPPSPAALKAGLRFSLELRLVAPTTGAPVQGVWVVSGVVLPGGATAVVAPSAGSLGTGTVSFGGFRLAGGVLEMSADVRGIPYDQLAAAAPTAGKPQAALDLALLDSNGDRLPVSYYLGSNGDVTHIEAFAFGVARGSYRLVLTLAGASSLERPLEVR